MFLDIASLASLDDMVTPMNRVEGQRPTEVRNWGSHDFSVLIVSPPPETPPSEHFGRAFTDLPVSYSMARLGMC